MKLTLWYFVALFFIFFLVTFEPYENYNEEFYKSNHLLSHIPTPDNGGKCSKQVADKDYGTLSAFLDNYKIRKIDQKTTQPCNNDPDKESYSFKGSSPFTSRNIGVDEIETSLTDQGELNKQNHYLMSPYYFNSNPKYKSGHMDLINEKQLTKRDREIASDLGERVDQLSNEESDRHQITSLSPQIWSLWAVTSENRDPR
mgnify:CR=1 FL=1|jgi:hypothetical protein|tara:strand:+ start:236 stop:835 length:600 start_codon:yes stop_codon:yes gene_type:complete